MRLITVFFTSVASLVSFAAPINNPLHIDWLDKKTNLGDNFYVYANGSWQTKNPIPLDRSSWGTFNILQDNTQENIRQILVSAAANKKAAPGSIEQKVGDFYFSGMDESSINSQGIAPLASLLSGINAIQTEDALRAEIAHLHLIGVGALFNFGSMQDFANSDNVIAAIVQGGLTLPDRDYYLKEDEKFKKIRAAYIQYITNMFILSGDNPKKASTNAKIILTIETSLASSSMSQTAQRDPHAIYHLMDRTQLEKIAPNFPWSGYFAAMGHPEIKQLNVAMPDFFNAMNQQLQQHSIDEWKTYLRWQVLNTFAPYLSQPFVDENFRMTTALTGAEKLLPRWKRVIDTENTALGFAIGEIYVKRYFSPTAKSEVLDMVHNIRDVLREDLQTLPWMTPATRKAAIKKLDLMGERIGYPDKWWDYSTLNIDRGPYVLNVIRANEFLVKRDLNKIGKPVDKDEWEMSPQTINAYYNPSMNTINFPTGILQPPFFDTNAPAAINYGSIGFVIGHEITHGFDDQGAQFDGHGNLHDWWTPEDLKKFKAATACIVKQFSTFKVAGDVPVQGELVVGEAAADLGGVTLAYRAYHKSSAYKQAKTINGFTPDQQFFLGTAHVWANNTRPEKACMLVTTDPHPPAMYRINGTFANMPAFQAIFNLPDNSPMVNPKRCVIW